MRKRLLYSLAIIIFVIIGLTGRSILISKAVNSGGAPGADIDYFASSQLRVGSSLYFTSSTNANITVLGSDLVQNNVLGFVGVSSSVNYFTMSNNATGTDPIFNVVGANDNINMALSPKGDGGVIVNETRNGVLQLITNEVSSGGDPEIGSPKIVLTGKYWDGANDTEQKMSLQNQAGGDNALFILGNDDGNRFAFSNNGQLRWWGASTMLRVQETGGSAMKNFAQFTSAINAVNFFDLSNSAASSSLSIGVAGDSGDSDVGIILATKGEGTIKTEKDIYITTSTRGIILTSPDGTCDRCTVSDVDLFTCASVTCPTY